MAGFWWKKKCVVRFYSVFLCTVEFRLLTHKMLDFATLRYEYIIWGKNVIDRYITIFYFYWNTD